MGDTFLQDSISNSHRHSIPSYLPGTINLSQLTEYILRVDLLSEPATHPTRPPFHPTARHAPLRPLFPSARPPRSFKRRTPSATKTFTRKYTILAIRCASVPPTRRTVLPFIHPKCQHPHLSWSSNPSCFSRDRSHDSSCCRDCPSASQHHASDQRKLANTSITLSLARVAGSRRPRNMDGAHLGRKQDLSRALRAYRGGMEQNRRIIDRGFHNGGNCSAARICQLRHQSGAMRIVVRSSYYPMAYSISSYTREVRGI